MKRIEYLITVTDEQLDAIAKLKKLLAKSEGILKRVQVVLPNEPKWDSLAQCIASMRGEIIEQLAEDKSVEHREIRYPVELMRELEMNNNKPVKI